MFNKYDENLPYWNQMGYSFKRKGELSKSSVLTEKQVSKIKEELQNGEKICNLAKKYNVGNMTISRIKNKKCWTHV